MIKKIEPPKLRTVDGNTFSSVLEIFTKDWKVTELTTTAWRKE